VSGGTGGVHFKETFTAEKTMQQITIPTPYPVGEVHIYSTEINGELVLFDTGPDTPEALDILRRQVDLSRLRHLCITHAHVDHYGLAGYIAEHTDAQIYIPRKDALKFLHHEKRLAGIGQLLEDFGFKRDFIAAFRKSVLRNSIFPSIPERFRITEESPELQGLGITFMACPGHSQSDLVYRCGPYAVSGDLLLKGIFQAPLLDINLDTLCGRFRNYEAYCSSLPKLGTLRGMQILPGHREGVDSLEATILFYIEKLLERAGRVIDFSRHDTVSGIAHALFDGVDVDPFIVYLKASEIIFMQDFLGDPDRLRHSLDSIGLLEEVRQNFDSLLSKQSAA
jgi:glyoxylase-like metal-dependent hydrolase (beta-lactamase superfamily II)